MELGLILGDYIQKSDFFKHKKALDKSRARERKEFIGK